MGRGVIFLKNGKITSEGARLRVRSQKSFKNSQKNLVGAGIGSGEKMLSIPRDDTGLFKSWGIDGKEI
jgi:hypothetical protein